MLLIDADHRVQPRFKNTSFFISGESYAGVYLPMLADQLVKGINAGDFTNNNFQVLFVLFFQK